MKLELIKDEVCPHCKSGIVAESCRNRHTNGQGFEERTFACGCVLSWSPNFNRLETRTPCPKHPDVIEKFAKRKQLYSDFMIFINQADVDDSFRESVSQHFPRHLLS